MNYFNRHENMGLETLQKIGKVINEVQFKQENSFTFVNYLYGRLWEQLVRWNSERY